MGSKSNKKEKIIKLVFMILFCAVVAYMLYVMISYYTADKESQVSLSFSSDSSNIMTKAVATYTMKENEGQLMLETNEKTNALTFENMVGKAFEIKSIGKAVSSAALTIIYDDDNIDYDEACIKLMRIDESGNPISYKSTVNTDTNTVTAEFFGGGMWYLGKF